MSDAALLLISFHLAVGGIYTWALFRFAPEEESIKVARELPPHLLFVFVAVEVLMWPVDLLIALTIRWQIHRRAKHHRSRQWFKDGGNRP